MVSSGWFVDRGYVMKSNVLIRRNVKSEKFSAYLSHSIERKKDKTLSRLEKLEV